MPHDDLGCMQHLASNALGHVQVVAQRLWALGLVSVVELASPGLANSDALRLLCIHSLKPVQGAAVLAGF